MTTELLERGARALNKVFNAYSDTVATRNQG
jgi:hypothetical protein